MFSNRTESYSHADSFVGPCFTDTWLMLLHWIYTDVCRNAATQCSAWVVKQVKKRPCSCVCRDCHAFYEKTMTYSVRTIYSFITHKQMYSSLCLSLSHIPCDPYDALKPAVNTNLDLFLFLFQGISELESSLGFPSGLSSPWSPSSVLSLWHCMGGHVE